MEGVEVPEHFVCPISLQIMKEPVTAVTGITYDRESIEKWLFEGGNNICPVTKTPLPRTSSELTPNHTLQRLIQSWSEANDNAAKGIYGNNKACVKHQNSNPPSSKNYANTLVGDLAIPSLRLKTLQKLDILVRENDRSRKHVAEAGAVRELLSFIVTCYENNETIGLEHAFNVLYTIRSFWFERNSCVHQFVLMEHDRIFDAIFWVLDCCGGGAGEDGGGGGDMMMHALCVLRKVVENGGEGRVKPEYLKKLLGVLKDRNGGRLINYGRSIKQQGTNAILHVMHGACRHARCRAAMIESGAVFELIELQINNPKEKKTTELVLRILSNLCGCADGRAQLLGHAAGVAAVGAAVLGVSGAADEAALAVLGLVSRYSAGGGGVAQEMLRVGTAAKLCMVLQADCGLRLKDKAREILRTHSEAWKGSPCVEVIATLRMCANT